MINIHALETLSVEKFKKKWPYPWHDFHDFLTPEAFQLLYEEFPPFELFEYHDSIRRGGGQRPHNRYYLAYEKSRYHEDWDEVTTGMIRHHQLSENWQKFMEELESKEYLSFIESALSQRNFRVRYAWHMGTSAGEVSPHYDTLEKLGTHIFYFNVEKEWNPEWGGSILVLGDKLTSKDNPDFSEFTTSTAVSVMDNHSFLFKNSLKSWHGVKMLKCPPGKYRRLFNVIFDVIQ